MEIEMMRSIYLFLLSLTGSFAITYLVSAYQNVSASFLGIFSIIVLAGLYYLYNIVLVRKTHWKRCLMLSVLLSFSTVGGIYLDANTLLENSSILQTGKLAILCIFLTPAFYCLLQVILKTIAWIAANGERVKVFKMPSNGLFYCLIITAAILLCWTPVWLAYYPGLWNYDPGQVWQVINHEYYTKHPLIHTLFMGVCFNFGYARGNSNLGVAIYDWAQMVLMSSIFAYSVLFLKRRTENHLLCLLMVIFYALFPVHSILAISSTKDVLFSALVLLDTMLAIQYSDCVRDKNNGKQRTRLSIGLLITTTVMLLFRNNASYAFAGFLCIALIFTLLRKVSWRAFALLLACMILYLGCNMALIVGLHAKKSSITEALSVPAEQFGRIYYSEEADEETKKLIEEYCNPQSMSYDPHLADYMKSSQSLDRIHTWEDVIPFFKSSLQLFARYPAISTDSFLYLTEGWWYLGDTSCAGIYGDENPGDRLGYLETSVLNGFGITHESKLPSLEALYERAFTYNYYQKVPLLSLVFAPALYIWLFAFFYTEMKRTHRFLFIFHWFLLFTVLMGPCCLVRYAYPFILVVPIMLGVIISERKQMTPLSRIQNQ